MQGVSEWRPLRVNNSSCRCAYYSSPFDGGGWVGVTVDVELCAAGHPAPAPPHQGEGGLANAVPKPPPPVPPSAASPSHSGSTGSSRTTDSRPPREPP